MKLNLQTFSISLPFQLKNKPQIQNWIKECFLDESNFSEVDISIIFCTDEELLKFNKNFLSHDYYTDIITFVLEESEHLLESELYISIDRVRENANNNFYDELNRVVIHGVLHLCGYKDKTDNDKAIMTKKENDYLSKI